MLTDWLKEELKTQSMAKQPKVLTEILIRQLHELANTPFELRAFRNRWEAFGWAHLPASDDKFGFSVRVPDALWITVDPHGNQVVSATLPFYYWEDFDPGFCKAIDYQRGREAYQAEFEAAKELVQRVLSPPAMRWLDAGQDAHEALVWSGEHGLLILQQANFDLQYGMELNFWLECCTTEEFKPETPLIDWLVARSRKLHNEYGFPPLQY